MNSNMYTTSLTTTYTKGKLYIDIQLSKALISSRTRLRIQMFTTNLNGW